MKKEEENYWEQIEELEWSKDHDYGRIEQYLKNYFLPLDIIALKNFVEDKQDDLMDRFDKYWLADPGIEVSDDGWSDLTAEVVGRGKKFYESITVPKLQKMAINRDYEENFSYSFQFTHYYK